ncbi:MAG: SpoIIE family protein phosphatase [Planctomycetota bacterium]
MFHKNSTGLPDRMLDGLVQGIVDNTPAVIYVKDLDYRYLLINRQFEKRFGVSRKAIVGQSDYDIFPRDLSDVFRKNDVFVAKTGESIECEEIAPHLDGPHNYLSVKFALRDQEGRVFAVAGISTDITDRLRSRSEIESLRRRYELILSSVGDGVCGLDADGRVVFLNPAAERMLGYKASELQGKCRQDFVVERRRSTRECPVEAVLNGGVARAVTDAVFRQKNGAHVPVEYVASPIVDGDHAIGAVITFRDVSDRIQRLRSEQEMLAARTVQQALYPKTDPVVANFEISGITHPASLTSGDYYDFITTTDGALVIVVGDVSGHGLGPALEMVETRASLRTILHYETNIGVVLSRLNRVLSNDLPEGMFVTLFAVRLDPQRRSMVYTSAGHQANILFQSDVVSRLDSTGTVLGLSDESPFATSAEIPLHSGDLVVLATDGIMEQISVSNDRSETELFGWNRTMQSVREHRHHPAKEILNHLCLDVRRFANGAPQIDDVTAVIIKVL